MGKTDRKLVYSVTLHPAIAEELRQLDPKGKLSRGITRAQELLSQPNVLEYAQAVESGQVEGFYARIRSGLYKTAVIPPEMRRAPAGEVIPPSVVLPTDNPFDDDQGPPGGVRGPQGTVAATSGNAQAPDEPGAPAESGNEPPSSEGPSAPASEPAETKLPGEPTF